MSRIGWGILGAGSPNALAIAQAIEASVAGALVAVAADIQKDAVKFADSFDDRNVKSGTGVKVYFKFEELLRDRAVDAVYIALPIKHNAEWIIKAIRAKKHVIFDPPFDISIEKMQDIMNTAKEVGNIFCMEAMLYRAHPFFESLKRLIVTEKKLGDIHHYNAIYTTGSTPNDHHRDGSILNEGCYPVSFIRHLVNAEPISIEGTGTMIAGSREDSEAILIMRFPNDIKATIQTANNVVMSWQFHVIGTKGTLSVISNPWFPGAGCEYHITLCDPLQPNTVPHRHEVFKSYKDIPLRSYTIDVLNQCIYIKGLPMNAVTLEHSLANIHLLTEWRAQVAAKQPTPENLHRQPLVSAAGHSYFKQKPPEEKEKTRALYSPPRLKGGTRQQT
jgi:predicted dehydrogenase